MKFKFVNTNGLITLPKVPLLNKIENASETEIKVLIYASATAENGTFDEKSIQKLSGLDLTEIIIALQFWRGAEVLELVDENKNVNASSKTDRKPSKALQKNDIPTYSGEEIERIFENNAEITLLIDECQELAGKIFNPLEINKIVSLYDYLGLSSEYILSIYDYCKKNNKTTVHYIEKTAFNLYNEGIDTDEKLREYLKDKEIIHSFEGKIRRIFGLGSRALSKKEADIVKKWIKEFNFPLEVIEYAYELTVNATSRPSLPYANKIMLKWFNAGYTTLEEVKNDKFDFKKKKEGNPPAESSFDNDEFFEAALKRSYDNIGKKSTN